MGHTGLVVGELRRCQNRPRHHQPRPRQQAVPHPGWPSAHSRPPGADYIIQAERNAIVYLLQNSGRLGVVALAMMVQAMAHRVHRKGEASE